MSEAMVAPHADLTELFRATILEHARHPRNQGTSLTAPDIESHGVNASCGDRITLRLCVDDAGIVNAIEWEGQGCAISQASVSMMTRVVKGKALPEVERIIEAFRGFLKGEAIPDGIQMGELEALTGVRQFPVRVKCALLGWRTLQEGIGHYHRAPHATAGGAWRSCTTE